MAFKRITEKTRTSSIQRMVNRGGAPWIDTDIPFFTPQDGDNMVRFLPQLEGEESLGAIGLEVYVYYGLGRTQHLSCTTLGKHPEDPLMAYYYAQDQDSRKESHIDQFRPTKRILLRILDFNKDDTKGELKWWVAPATLIGDIINASKNRRTGALEPFEDPEEGKIVFFTKSGSGINTKYSGVALDQEVTAIDPALGDDLPLYESVLLIPEPAELEKLLDAHGLNNQHAAEEAPPPARTSRASAATPDPEPEAPARTVEKQNTSSVRDRLRRRNEAGE